MLNKLLFELQFFLVFHLFYYCNEIIQDWILSGPNPPLENLQTTKIKRPTEMQQPTEMQPSILAQGQAGHNKTKIILLAYARCIFNLEKYCRFFSLDFKINWCCRSGSSYIGELLRKLAHSGYNYVYWYPPIILYFLIRQRCRREQGNTSTLFFGGFHKLFCEVYQGN